MNFLFRWGLNIIDFIFSRGIFLTLSISISGCVETVNSSLPSAVSLLSDEKKIIISAPNGFCVDQGLVSKAKGSITIFVIDCVKVNSSTGIITKRRPVSAILTATVIDFQSLNIQNVRSLKELLTKKPGINFLSRANTNSLIKVHQVDVQKELLFFLIEQRGSDIDVEQSNYFWRVFFFVEGKIISMTASNFLDSSNSKKRLKKLIGEFAKNTLVANIN